MGMNDMLAYGSKDPLYDENWAYTQLRRVLDTLAGRKTFRCGRYWRPPSFKPNGDDMVRGETETHAQVSRESRILDANNRFSVLFADWDQGEEPSLTIPEPMIMLGGQRPNIQDLREVRKWQTNVARVRLNMAPLPVDEEKLNRAKPLVLKADSMKSLTVKILRPLFRWREEVLPVYLRTRDPEDLTHAPLILLEAYEQWVRAILSSTEFRPPKLLPAFGSWDIPRMWDTDPRMSVGEREDPFFMAVVPPHMASPVAGIKCPQPPMGGF